ncbi:MAG: hypothetical protein AMXMBFR33_68580 [Candidatus Xenobia bacterium]
MQKTGRNDPCPCGSGLKHKKCCLEKEQAATPPVHPAHAVDHQLVERLGKLLDGKPARWLEELVDDYDGGYDADLDAESTWFYPYAFYHYRGTHDADPTLLEELLERSRSLTGPELELARAHQAAHVSLWQMLQARNGCEVLLRDMLLGDQRWVYDVGLVESFRPGLAFLGRVLELAGQHILIGMFPRPLPPASAESIASEFLAFHKPHRKVTRKLLQEPDGVIELTDSWRDEVESLDDQPLPRVFNAAGHDLVLVRDRFVFESGARDEVRQRLSQHRRFVLSGERGHLETEGGKIMGSFELQDRALIVETSSIEHAEEIEALLRGWAVPGWKRARRDKRSPEKLLQKGGKVRPASQTPLPPEALEALMTLKRDWMRRWLDEQVPALDGHTPREAARNPKLRDRLRVLLDDIEFRESACPSEQQSDIGWLRKELGLTGAPAH